LGKAPVVLLVVDPHSMSIIGDRLLALHAEKLLRQGHTEVLLRQCMHSSMIMAATKLPLAH
jgi:hypothetical protein